MNAQQIQVLLAVDEAVHANLARELPRAPSQFALTRVGRLDEALRRLDTGPFDVVLLDLSLPDRTGLAAYHELHATAPAMPIVVLTGSGDETLALQAVREGAQDYLVKGEFDGKMLSRAIRYALERKGAEEELRQNAEFFRLISDNVTDLIAVIDRDGKRLYNNPSYEKSLENALSELHQAHEELKAAQMQLIQSERLEAVSTFAGGIAHEVKNPLQTITLGVDFLKNSFGNAGEDVRMVLTEMDNAARRADAVSRGMVEFSSFNKRDVKDHDLSRIAEQSLCSVESEIKHNGIKLIKDLAPNLPPVR